MRAVQMSWTLERWPSWRIRTHPGLSWPPKWPENRWTCWEEVGSEWGWIWSGEMCHVVGDNNGHGQACHWEQVCIPSYDNDIDAYNNVAIAGVDTIAVFEIHRPRVWMIWTSPSTLFCWLAWLLSQRWPSSCVLLRGREDTGTRNENPYGMSGHVVWR